MLLSLNNDIKITDHDEYVLMQYSSAVHSILLMVCSVGLIDKIWFNISKESTQIFTLVYWKKSGFNFIQSYNYNYTNKHKPTAFK